MLLIGQTIDHCTKRRQVSEKWAKASHAYAIPWHVRHEPRKETGHGDEKMITIEGIVEMNHELK